MNHNLDQLAAEIREINQSNGWEITQPSDWEDTYKIPAILALIHSEISEALEAFRDNDRKNFGEELADILIRVLDCAPGLGVDIESEVRQKLDRNRLRRYQHGGKRL